MAVATLQSVAVTASSIAFRNVYTSGASTVYCIAHDKQGLVWMGTENELYSYDGYHTYPHFTIGTKENTLVHALSIAEGKIFIGTDAGMLVYDINTSSYAAPPSSIKGDIRAFALRGTRLAIGGSDGISFYDIQTEKTEQTKISLPDVYSLIYDGQGNLMAGTINGLFACRGGKAKAIGVKQGRQPLVNALATCGPSHGHKELWIGTEGTLCMMRGGHISDIDGLGGNSVKSIAEAGGQMFIGTDNGLYIIGGSGKTQHLTHDSRLATSIANNIVWAVKADRYGNLWVGTDNGLSIMPAKQAARFIPLSQITGSGEGNCLHAMLSEADGTMWMGGTNGLIRCQAKPGGKPFDFSSIAWYKQNDPRHTIPHNRIRKIFSDSEGNVIACTDHGLVAYDRKSRAMRNFIVSDRSGRYTTTWAYDIVEDRQGRYWIASYMGGVFVISKKKLMASGGRAVADRHFANELQGIHVGSLAIDGKGNVWLRAYKKGIDRIDAKDMTVEHITKDETFDLASDGQGNVMASMNGRIVCFAPSGKPLRTYRITADGNGNIASMAAFDGQLWVLLGGNVCCVFWPDGSSMRFGLHGFHAINVWHDSHSGMVLFGGNDGIMAVSPSEIKKEDSWSGLLLTGIDVNDVPFRLKGESPQTTHGITLDYNENNIRLKFTDLPFDGKLSKVMAYRLEGADHSWKTLTNGQKSISYNGLPHGSYRLRICLVDGSGNIGAEVYGLDIEVLPPWYLTVWAKLAYLILLAGLAAWAANSMLVRKRLREERAAKKQIMEQSKARTAFFDNLSKQLKIPMGKIMATVHALLPYAANNQEERKLENIRRDIMSMNRLVGNSLDIQGSQSANNGEKRTAERIDLVDFCRRIVDDNRPAASAKKARLTFKTTIKSVDAELDLVRFQPLLCSAIELATTAVPQSEEVTVSVSADSKQGCAYIKIRIGGLSVPDDKMAFLFYRYFNVADIGGKQPADGLNELSMLKSLVEAHSGSATADNEGGKALCISIAIPVCSPAASEGAEGSGGNAKSSAAIGQNDSDAKLLDKITQVIEANIGDSDFNVTKLQELSGIGDKLLYRRIKQMTGKSPVEFIRHMRMQRAAMLLGKGKFSVSEVMYMVGFSNSSYFSKCFQKAYGMTPSEYSGKTSY